MPRVRETDFIFDALEKPNLKDCFGYLGIEFNIFKELTEIRTKKGMTQEELSQKTGIARSTIAKIEAGRTNPTLAQLVKIAHTLDVKIKLEPMTPDEIKADKGQDMECYMK